MPRHARSPRTRAYTCVLAKPNMERLQMSLLGFKEGSKVISVKNTFGSVASHQGKRHFRHPLAENVWTVTLQHARLVNCNWCKGKCPRVHPVCTLSNPQLEQSPRYPLCERWERCIAFCCLAVLQAQAAVGEPRVRQHVYRVKL